MRRVFLSVLLLIAACALVLGDEAVTQLLDKAANATIFSENGTTPIPPETTTKTVPCAYVFPAFFLLSLLRY